MEDQCANCGVVVAESAADRHGLHPIQELYRTNDGMVVCEACFFQDGHDEDGETIAGRALARDLSFSELAERLAEVETRDRIRWLCSNYRVSRERGMTKRETARALAEVRPEVVGRYLVTREGGR